MTSRFTRILSQTILWFLSSVAYSSLANAQPELPNAPQIVPSRHGLIAYEEGATEGYTLFAPLSDTVTYLIDNNGNEIRTWKSDYRASGWVFLSEDGFLYRGGEEALPKWYQGGGHSGRVEKFTFDGNLVWSINLGSENLMPHHDAVLLPSGNLLILVWTTKNLEEALESGRHRSWVPEGGVWDDGLMEFEIDGAGNASVVWEWRAWDHLIQDVDPQLPNFGDIGRHPELIDINGDIENALAVPRNPSPDVFHMNSVDYNEDLDQILVSVPTFNEIWIMDRSAPTNETSENMNGSSRGASDLSYRWGNPRVYRRGTANDRQSGFQHDAQWIRPGLPGSENIILFSNRTPRSGTELSQIIELDVPINAEGDYLIETGLPFGPEGPVWTYFDSAAFNSSHLSGVQRLWTGNTLVTSGVEGLILEVSPDGRVVWEYGSPYPKSGLPTSVPRRLFTARRLPADYPGLRGLTASEAGN